MIEARVAFAPYEPHGWRPEPPTVKSWRFLKDQCNVTGVRLQYLYSDARWWQDAFVAALDGGMEIHGNFCAPDDGLNAITPQQIEDRAFAWTATYGVHMKSASFGNEPGYSFGPDDIAKGGARDYMRELVDNFWLPFTRGVRRANPNITIGGPDAESAETLQRFVDLVDVDEWLVHPYGEREIADDGELDYATMAGENGKPGFISVSRMTLANEATDRRRRPLIISEIDHQQHKAARARGEQRGIATDAEIDQLTTFSIRMRDEFHAPAVTFGTAEYFCTRIKCGLWRGKFPGPAVVAEAALALGIPDLTAEWLIESFGDTWSTWTYPDGGDPVMSESGKRLAAVFAKPAPKIDMRNARRRVIS